MDTLTFVIILILLLVVVAPINALLLIKYRWEKIRDSTIIFKKVIIGSTIGFVILIAYTLVSGGMLDKTLKYFLEYAITTVLAFVVMWVWIQLLSRRVKK